MTDRSQPATSAAAPATGAPSTEGQPPAEWKPEPRQWTWKDLFTAPMLAFKPKCMLVGAITVIALGLLHLLYAQSVAPAMGQSDTGKFWLPFVEGGFATVALLVFSLGAVFVSVFYKADLLDDEFLSLKEGLAAYSNRLLPALLVPLFLVLLVVGVGTLLLWIPLLVGSIPYAGPALYALLYPIGYFMGVFFLLTVLAVVLGTFVFPAIIAVRRHGWFDNVVDTIEAVGTKPHVLVASWLLTVLMTAVAYGFAMGGMSVLKGWSASAYVPGHALTQTEQRASQIRSDAMARFDPFAAATWDVSRSIRNFWGQPAPDPAPSSSHEIYVYWGPGLVVGGWQVLFTALALGYCFNLLLAGGMLTYLVVREDDYWDDEDLEDLDKLAKELEEEAKREAEPKGDAASPAASAPASGSAPATGSAPASGSAPAATSPEPAKS